MEFWIIIFAFAFLLEAWHDSFRARHLDKGCPHDFMKSRISKIIKGVGWTCAVLVLAYREGNWWLALLYWGEKNILFHPLYRIFSDGLGFVFSWRGIRYMLEHSELYYWILILRKKAGL